MTDAELEAAIARNEGMAQALDWASNVPGGSATVGAATSGYSKVFENSANRMREILERRKKRGDHH